MGTYIIRRLIQAIPIIIGISIICFAIIILPRVTRPIASGRAGSPGGDREPDPDLRPRQAAPRSSSSSGSRLLEFLEAGRVGLLLHRRAAGPDKIFARIPATLLLMGTSLFVTMIIAIPLGILAAVKQYSWADKIITTLATIGYAMPSFGSACMLLHIFSIKLDLFPLFGMQSLGKEGNPVDIAWHLVLPA